MAYEKLHSTTIMAAKTALLSNTKKLIITHLVQDTLIKIQSHQAIYLKRRKKFSQILTLPKIF